MKNILLKPAFISLVVLLTTCTSAMTWAAAFTVQAGDTEGLIAAIEQANAAGLESSIRITPGENGETDFVFTMPYGESGSALPPITTRLLIWQSSDLPDRVRFRRDENAGQFRMAEVPEGGRLDLRNFEMRDFNSDGAGGAINVTGGTLLVSGCRFLNNEADGTGGAVSLSGRGVLMVYEGRFPGESQDFYSNTEFSGNTSHDLGGAIYLGGRSNSYIRSALFSRNNSSGSGCDIFVNTEGKGPNDNALELHSCSFDGNCPLERVYIREGDVLSSGNTFAGQGTALYSTQRTRLLASIFGNSDPGDQPEQAQTKASGPRPENGCGSQGPENLQSLGYNLEIGESCNLDQPTDMINTDPMLGESDGGIFALLDGSPAIDNGPSEIANAVDQKFGLPCPYVDIRGLGRPQDSNLDGVYECDIGSWEKQGGPDIGPAQSGAYYDIERNGEGDFLELIGGGLAFVAKFTYAMDGSGPVWFVGIGDQVGNSVVVREMLQPTGGVFGAGFNPDNIIRTPVGSQSMVFSNCSAGASPGKMTFQAEVFEGEFGDLLNDAYRLTSVVGCEGEQSPQSGRSGSFFDLARDGEGIFVQWLPGGQVVIIWYTFDTEGNQMWIISESAVVDGSTVTAQMLYPAASTSYGENFDPSEIDLQSWGTVTLEYQPGCNSVKFSYNSTVGTYGEGSYDYVRLTSLEDTACDL